MLACVSACLVILAALVLPVGWLAWHRSIPRTVSRWRNYRASSARDIYWRSVCADLRYQLVVTAGAAARLSRRLAPSRSRKDERLILATGDPAVLDRVLVRAYPGSRMLQRTVLAQPALQYLGIIEDPWRWSTTLRTWWRPCAHPAAVHGVAAHATQHKIRTIVLRLLQASACEPGPPFWLIFLPWSAARRSRRHARVFVLCLGFYIRPSSRGGLSRDCLDAGEPRCPNSTPLGAASAVGVVLLLSGFAIFLIVGRFIPLDRLLGQK